MAGVILREKIYGIVQNDHKRLPVGFNKTRSYKNGRQNATQEAEGTWKVV